MEIRPFFRLALPVMLSLAACGHRPGLRPFTTDGCTLFPDSSRGHDWHQCCTEHDHKYWQGGTKADRRQADLDLRNCVASAGRPKLATLMLLGVRAGGTPYLPTYFRWGYGWPYLRGYGPLLDEEKKLVDGSPRP